MIHIALCALNEAQNLKTLIPNIIHECDSLNHEYEIVICLDGGNDNSPQLLAQFNKVRILPVTDQRGLGAAYKRLFLEAIEKFADDDYLISMDADNTHDPKQIKELLSHAKNLKLDFAVGSRFVKGSKMSGFPVYRQAISKTVSIILQTLLPIRKIDNKKLQDYSSGYRIYKVSALKDLFKAKQNDFVTERDFIYTCEILLNLSRNNARIDEIALNYDYAKKIGESKLSIKKNAKRLLGLIARYIK